MTDTADGPNPDRALRPRRHRAALAGALGELRPVRHRPAGHVAAQVLPAHDVPVPVGRPAHRPLVHRDADRRARALPADARRQRLLPDRLRRLRPAGRERRHQERRPPVQLDDAQHREHAPPVPDDGRDVRLGRTRSSPPTRTTTAGTSGSSCASWSRAWPTARRRRSTGAPRTASLAREQVEGADRRCWRCGTPVEKRDLEQWFLRTTTYADELLDFTGIDWPEPIRIHADQLDRPVRGRRDRLHDRRRTSTTPGGEELRVFTTRPDTLFGATFMVLAPGAPAGRDADRARSARPRSTRTSSRPAGGPRSSACRPTARRPAWPSAPTPSTRSTASASRSGSPTTCWPATARARSWPCPPTTSATSRSPSEFGLPIRRVVAAPGIDGRRRRWTTPTSPTPPTSVSSTAAATTGMPADEGGAAIVAELADDAAQAEPQGHLPPARLAGQPPALLGHAHPGRLLRARRHRARPRRPAAGAAARGLRLQRAAAATR